MSGKSYDCDVALVGAGIVGLASAAAVAESGRSVVVLDCQPGFGREASSRNSEVVHSGIYYPKDSKKTRLCIEGREALYAYCARRNVPHRKTGKIVVATSPAEVAWLESRLDHARSVSVPAEPWTAERVASEERKVKALAALFFPETGIVDSHELMRALEADAAARGAIFAYGHRVTGLDQEGDGWGIAAEKDGEKIRLTSRALVNAAGFDGPVLSAKALGGTEYEHRPCAGRYLTLGSRWRSAFHRLIYPVPPKDGLGVHVTLDLQGSVRLGPDVQWIDPKSPRAEWHEAPWDSLRRPFFESARRFLPDLKPEDLGPGLVGIRTKLFRAGTALPDFVVERKGSFVHCLGIESPGLTASLAIGREAARLVGELW